MLTETWEERADCRDRDPRLWDGEDVYADEKAKEICFRCPVMDRCLIDAMVNEEPFTVRGAHTAEERENYRPEFRAKYAKELGLLQTRYKRKTIELGGRQERRLAKCRISRRLIHPGLDRYDEYRQILDFVIRRPQCTALDIGRDLGRSESWVNHTLAEIWEVAS